MRCSGPPQSAEKMHKEIYLYTIQKEAQAGHAILRAKFKTREVHMLDFYETRLFSVEIWYFNI